MQAGESYLRHMGKYPVISISLKSAKQMNFDEAFACLKESIAKEYAKYEYLINGRLTNQADLQKYGRIRSRQAERGVSDKPGIPVRLPLSGHGAQVYHID